MARKKPETAGVEPTPETSQTLDLAVKQAGAELLKWLVQMREHDRHPLSKDPHDPRPILGSLSVKHLLELFDALDDPEFSPALLPTRQLVAVEILMRDGKIKDWQLGPLTESGFSVNIVPMPAARGVLLPDGLPI